MTVEFTYGVLFQSESTETFPVDIVPPEGTKVELTQLVSMNRAFEFMLVDGRIGDRLLPIHGPIDLGFYAEYPRFEMGSITEEDHLRLYIEVFGTPSVYPILNFVVTGEMETWTPPECTEPRRHRVGELSLLTWRTPPQVPMPFMGFPSWSVE